jgi:cell division protein ZapA
MRYDVQIFGQIYALRADADEEHVKKVADLVDSKMREVAAGSQSVSTLQIAVLAALDIASEFLQSDTASERFTTMIEARSEAMAQRIDALIPEVCVP